MKKLVSLILMAVLVLGTLAGCTSGGDDGSENVELNWYVFIGEQTELERANDYINEELAKVLPNTTLNIVQDPGFASKWSMWMAGQEPIDIAWTGYMVSMNNEVTSDSYLPLDDLLEEYGEAILEEKELFDYEYSTGVYNGATYALPNLQPIMNQTTAVVVPEALYQYMDVEALTTAAAKSPKTTREVLDVIDKYLSNVAANVNLNDYNLISYETIFQNIMPRGYNWVGSQLSDCYLCYDAFDDNAEIQTFFATEEFKLFMEYVTKWNKMGLINNSLKAGSLTKLDILSAIGNEIRFNTIEGNENVKATYNTDGSVKTYRILMDTYDQMYRGCTSFGLLATYTCLPHTCRNPERAMKLLNILKTDEGIDLLNAICFGIEGRHYTLEYCEEYDDYVAIGADYDIQPTDSSAYGVPNWEVGNTYKTYRTPVVVDGQKEYCLDYIENIRPTHHKTAYYGFSPMFTGTTVEYQNCVSAISEYVTYLTSGSEGDNWKTVYDKLIKELDNCGIQAICDDLMTQAEKK